MPHECWLKLFPNMNGQSEPCHVVPACNWYFRVLASSLEKNLPVIDNSKNGTVTVGKGPQKGTHEFACINSFAFLSHR